MWVPAVMEPVTYLRLHTKHVCVQSFDHGREKRCYSVEWQYYSRHSSRVVRYDDLYSALRGREPAYRPMIASHCCLLGTTFSLFTASTSSRGVSEWEHLLWNTMMTSHFWRHNWWTGMPVQQQLIFNIPQTLCGSLLFLDCLSQEERCTIIISKNNLYIEKSSAICAQFC